MFQRPVNTKAARPRAMFCVCCATEEDRGSLQAVPVDDGDHPGMRERGMPSERKAAAEAPAPAVAPSQPSLREEVRDFAFTIDRPDLSTPLGAVLDPSGSGAIHVCGILPGETAVGKANRRAPEARQLKAGDFITEVNGVSGDLTGMLNEVLSSASLAMQVRRPEEYEIVVNRRGGTLGCGITYDACNGNTLTIESVNDGPISAWNAANSDRPVRVGDRIVAANAKSGSSTELLEFIRAMEGDVRLRFARPATLDPEADTLP